MALGKERLDDLFNRIAGVSCIGELAVDKYVLTTDGVNHKCPHTPGGARRLGGSAGRSGVVPALARYRRNTYCVRST